MVSLAVVNLKDIIKYLVRITITVVVVVSLTKYFFNEKKAGAGLAVNYNFQICLNKSIPLIAQVNANSNGQEDKPQVKKGFYKSILTSELKTLDVENLQGVGSEKEMNVATDNETQKENEGNPKDSSNEEEGNEEIQLAQENVATEVQETDVVAKFTNEHNGVKIKNESKILLTEEMLSQNVTVNKKDIILFHTHTCESYTPTEKNMYESTGNYRTTNLEFSVARVGKKLKNQLKEYGYSVTHNTSYHDYPAYSGSYGRSLETVSSLIKSKDQIVIDIHRDAVGSKPNYAPTVKIGDESVAQLMFVIGTNGSGLEHDNWLQNLNFAIKLQEKANEIYPGLFKPIILRNSRYNQHLTTAATIIEVGATGNTLEQCIGSMKYLAKVIDAM